MTVSSLALVFALVGCRADEGEVGSRTQGSARIGGDVVATVDGVGITLDDLLRVTASTGFTASEALRRLEEKELLAAHAERRAFGEGVGVRRVERRAAVHRVLIEVENELGGEGAITETEIESAWSSSFSGHAPEIGEEDRQRVRDTLLIRRRLGGVGQLLRELEGELGVERESEAIDRLLGNDLGGTAAQ